jgi:N-hydroxyarylamine O-acetyltransferase
MNIDAYLRRIRYDGSRVPSAQTLRALQHAHLQTVPFENLDIHLGHPIALDHDALFEKIVVRRRGGFCYELNGLFAGLLRGLGFHVTLLSAGVARADGTGFGPEFDHLTLLVRVPNEASSTSRPQSLPLQPAVYLVDVGFGDSPVAPLRLDDDAGRTAEHGGRAYRFDREGERITLLKRTDNAPSWSPEYRFTLQPHQLTEYADMCHYHQTSPASHFTQKRLLTLPTPQGRVTLSELRLIITEDGDRTELAIAESDYSAVLRERFGIDLEWKVDH